MAHNSLHHQQTVNSLLLNVPAQPLQLLKRPASPSFEGMEESSRKRQKEHVPDGVPGQEPSANVVDEEPAVDGGALVNGLAEELQCGCCAALVYRPVIVSPCQHFFCGR